jgi:plasmid stability protein
VYLDPETLKALRIRAIEEGESATALVERLITDYLKTKRRKRDA